jgi:hypothetical protein
MSFAPENNVITALLFAETAIKNSNIYNAKKGDTPPL